MTRREVRLSPSSINYEDRRCDRCMGESYNGERWPDGPFPGIFAKLDSQQRRYFTGRSTADIDSALASGVIENGGRVESAPISVGSVDFTLRGNMDALIRFDDGTVGVVDYKSTTAHPDLAGAYRPQLAAYAWALEHPASAEAQAVTAAGLLVFAPEEMVDTDQGRAYLVSATWIPVEIPDDWFEDFLSRLEPLIESPRSASSAPNCGWCDLRRRMRRS